MVSPSFNANLKLICFGETTVPNAWRSFQRPIDWKALVETLDALFVVPPAADIDIDLSDVTERTVLPGVKVSLLAGLTRQDRLYLRARLAVAGMTEVDEAETTEAALIKATHRHYDLAIVSLALNANAPWSLVQALKGLPTPVESVIAVTANASWKTMEEAEIRACAGLLETPFSPHQIVALLRKV
jgi:CheY-like chemotaxis protein